MRPALVLPFVAFSLACAASPQFELISVKRIWDQAPHSAFGDIIRFHDQWFCIFREGLNHVTRPGVDADGKLRVIASKDGETWQSMALIEESGIDLRDPHLSITADGRLMAVAGGSEYPNGHYAGRQPRVMFSTDGSRWTAPAKVLERGHWLWRVTWYKGKAYGISKYGSPSKEVPSDPRRQNLVSSTDGLHWETVTELKVPGGDESTVRFLSDGRMVALMRRQLPDDDLAYIGVSKPPYRQWNWSKTNFFVGGPNFIVLPHDSLVAGGRWYQQGDPKSAKTAIGPMTLTSYQPHLVLPSNGDSSYPGFAFQNGVLWILYYSSHEGKTAIYLAKARIKF
ncbi:MAG TPA: sialidase family protein [Bryobacteraceae bacterium]|nr:sialidase family protein [Bryobacteraceae bacterium]